MEVELRTRTKKSGSSDKARRKTCDSRLSNIRRKKIIQRSWQEQVREIVYLSFFLDLIIFGGNKRRIALCLHGGTRFSMHNGRISLAPGAFGGRLHEYFLGEFFLRGMTVLNLVREGVTIMCNCFTTKC